MAGLLSNVFDSGSDSSSESNSDLLSDVSGTIGIDASNETSSSSTDEDGSSEESSSAQNFGADIDTDSLLGGSNDSMSETDGDSGGGLLG